MIKSIHDSSQEERQKLIDALFQCQNGNCDSCGICQVFKGTSPQAVYKEYIEGKKEFAEITQEMNQKK